MAFDWRQFVDISSGFSPAGRARVVQALQQIVDTGPEGVALITKAARMQGGRIMLLARESGSSADRPGIIEISLQDIDRAGLYDQGMLRPDHVIACLTHEFYHAADPLMQELILAVAQGKSRNFRDLGVFGARLQRTLTMLGVDQARQSGIVSELEPAFIFRLHQALNADPPYSRQEIHEKLGQFPGLQALFLSRPIEQIRRAAYLAGLADNKGILYWEHDAVRYTDEFMRKYFGDQAPWRGDYNNAVDFLRRDPEPLPLLTDCARPAVDGFAAPAYRNIEPPSIAPQFARQEIHGVCAVTSAGPTRFPTTSLLRTDLTPSPPRVLQAQARVQQR